MDNLKLISYNCRGLNNTKKRRDVFDFLKTKQAHIYCLQDCHFTPDMKNRIYSEWDGDCFFSFGQSIQIQEEFAFCLKKTYQSQ